MGKFTVCHDREMVPYFLMLSCIDHIGRKTYESIEERYESPRAFWEAGPEKAGDLLSPSQLKAFGEWKKVRPLEYMELLKKRGIHFLSCEDPSFPRRLLNIFDCPVGLFYYGKLPEEEMPTVGVIGARECSYYGEEVASLIGETLGKYKIPVISGMARGIDSLSQIGALDGGGTSYALLGGGPDICYPRESRNLYERLKATGGIISEYPPGVQPRKENFVRRNRLIAGFSDYLCVVEAKKKSGTLITVDDALEQGRDVFAVPGRITDRTSVGCNELIRQGAEIINDPEGFARDILRRSGILMEEDAPSPGKEELYNLSYLEQEILKLAGDDSFTPEELLKYEEMKQYSNAYEILTACMNLSFEGLLANMGGGRFRKKEGRR